MYTKLFDHIKQNLLNYSHSDIQIIKEYFVYKQVKRKEFFLEQESICRQAGFVLKGCFRNYVISIEGKEVNTQFSFENWWVGDIGSFVNRTPSQINIQALEDSELLIISAKNYSALLEKSPCFTEYTHKLRSNAHLSAVLRFSGLSVNAGTRYKLMLEKFPNIEQRISQKNIASFLQITPEALCRLRKLDY
jgi:CRP-like cAMP-binding protein